MSAKPKPMTLAEVVAAHPVPKGWSATEPEEQTCQHEHPGQWHRWEWKTKTGSEEDSEPVILETPPGCHECNCTDPFCPRCNGDD